MRVVFAGTPEFALQSLLSTQSAGFEVVLVLTQPDRPAGRGLKLHASPVKAYALEQGLQVAQPRSLRLDGKFPADAQRARQSLLAARPDAIVVAAYGMLLPTWVLELPRFGCLNVHASLLPRWRGAAPIQRAIEAGDTHTGITIMQMDTGLDTGDILAAQSIEISPGETGASLLNRLAPLGGRLLVQALGWARQGSLVRVPQPDAGVAYARKVDKAEAPIDWSETAQTIERRIRAFDPTPGASALLGAEVLKCWRAELIGAPGSAPVVQGLPGEILAVEPAGVAVACGTGALRLTELQRGGGKRLPAQAFLAGQALQVSLRAGMRFAARTR
ncbi:MAG: methionyl-tRNA formyltransferase [Burkholderiaceae bacterium]